MEVGNCDRVFGASVFALMSVAIFVAPTNNLRVHPKRLAANPKRLGANPKRLGANPTKLGATRLQISISVVPLPSISRQALPGESLSLVNIPISPKYFWSSEVGKTGTTLHLSPRRKMYEELSREVTCCRTG
ncbi:hypothetical protein PQG02_00270 (plasmid) [Nostoc sp. UHCC 0926]|uniref:hypothetical protein n=1 Tax=Nostoc sp. UHCC 0926 TaxID=3025190 RepID=UPI00235E3C96|nr:hypothetical protein [Nostoc sp. UHCC 0926]WDD30122.1 hypothetical protein PQG02_00270 [Nostoc sp. UHCC 0926]